MKRADLPSLSHVRLRQGGLHSWAPPSGGPGAPRGTAAGWPTSQGLTGIWTGCSGTPLPGIVPTLAISGWGMEEGGGLLGVTVMLTLRIGGLCGTPPAQNQRQGRRLEHEAAERISVMDHLL